MAKRPTQTPRESSEAATARRIKMKISDALVDVVQVFEDARRDGFTVAFAINPNKDRQGAFEVQGLTVTKSW